jgi:hypothetical protein
LAAGVNLFKCASLGFGAPRAANIILRPSKLRGEEGWEVFESEQVKPFYVKKERALGYAQWRAMEGRCVLEERGPNGQLVQVLHVDQPLTSRAVGPFIVPDGGSPRTKREG